MYSLAAVCEKYHFLVIMPFPLIRHFYVKRAKVRINWSIAPRRINVGLFE